MTRPNSHPRTLATSSALALMALAASCKKPPRPSSPPPVVHDAATTHSAPTMKTSYFGTVDPGDAVVMLMDGGTHGASGHTLSWDARGRGRWERRVDSMDPRPRTGSGELTLDAATLARVEPWLTAAFELARGEGGHLKRFGPIEDGPPRWVWAIVLSRNGERVLLEGGGLPSSAPPELDALLDWLRTDVDARVPADAGR